MSNMKQLKAMADYLITEIQKDTTSMEERTELIKQLEAVTTMMQNGKAKKTSSICEVIKAGTGIGAVVAPLVFYGIWMDRGFKFEEEGTYTSQTFKGLTNKFSPTRI